MGLNAAAFPTPLGGCVQFLVESGAKRETVWRKILVRTACMRHCRPYRAVFSIGWEGSFDSGADPNIATKTLG